MNYKEALYFIAKCLTISLEEKNKKEVEEQLAKAEIDWDAVVKISTAHFVFPALYCNLKRVDFLHYIPNDLVEYMQYITQLNRERNEQIIVQAKDVNQLLIANDITPIFLKGTGNLLEGLYDDIAERMVGDIDFVFSKDDYPRAIELIHGYGYSKVIKKDYDFPEFVHYPKLNKQKNIAAIEIHKELLIEKYASEFNYKLISKDSQFINGVHVMSFQNQLSLSIIANQINDNGFHYKSIALRNAYDVFLLSKKTIARNSFSKFKKLESPLNCFLAICYEVFDKPNSLEYDVTKESENYLNIFKKNFLDLKQTNRKYKKTRTKLFIKMRIAIIRKSLFDKEYRSWLINKVTDKDWQQQKLIQLRIRKPKPNA